MRAPFPLSFRHGLTAVILVGLAACGVASLATSDKADAAAITGAGLGATRGGTSASTWTPPPFTYAGLNGNGQSLSIGVNSVVLDSGPQPFGVLAILDDAGEDAGYQDANSPTLWIHTGQSPIRPQIHPTLNYPTNIKGECVDHCYAYQLAAYAKDAGETYPTQILTENGESGHDLVELSEGTTSWNGAAMETNFFHRTLGSAYGMGSILFTHGETDANDHSTTYGTDLEVWTTNYRAMILTHTLQTYSPRLIQTEQSASPAPQLGDLTTADVANGQISASQNDPTIVLAGPKYQFDAYYEPTGGPHMINTGYCLVGELAARAEWVEENGTHFRPIWLTSVSRSSNVVTETFNVTAPSTALVFDPTNGDNMHAGGALAAYWGNEYGFEAYDQAVPGGGSAVTDNGGANEWTWSVAHGLSNGTILYIENSYQLSTSNGLCTVAVIDATHFVCTGSTFTTATAYGAFKPNAFVPIQISGVTVSGNVVTITLARPPVGSGLVMSYGYYTDLALDSPEEGTGGWIGGAGRGGALRGNAVALTGARTGIAQYDWAVNFGQLSVP